ncbi:Flavinator of succinate dehydrogenase [Rickettsiales bacterium Ac37b]|nr:Flavinator of succinate dehydrogenase [Rickettsiales bacterium Ac37b]
MDQNIKKKLLYRSKHRGCKEMDLLLGGFASRNIGSLDSYGIIEYDELLSEDDSDIFNWIIGRQKVPLRLENNKILHLLIEFQTRKRPYI